MEEHEAQEIRQVIKFAAEHKTQTQIAKEMGVGSSTLSDFLLGRGNPYGKTETALKKYAEILRIHPQEPAPRNVQAGNPLEIKTGSGLFSDPPPVLGSASPEPLIYANASRAGLTNMDTADSLDPLVHEFFLPVVQFAWFTDRERAIIDHPAFQR